MMCRHRADTFVLVFRIVNTSGCAGFTSTPALVWVVLGLGGVSPPFEPKPMIENNSGALRCILCAHAHGYLVVYLVHNSSSVALQPHGGASQPAGGSAIHVGDT